MHKFLSRYFSEFESPLPHKNNTLKPVTTTGFNISSKNSVSSMSAMFHYRKPRLVKAKTGWYVLFYYRIPEGARHLYGNKEWMRFREKDDINRRKGTDKEIYADFVLTEITNALKKGYNPFDPELEHVADQIAGIELPTVTDADKALKLFLEAWSKRGL